MPGTLTICPFCGCGCGLYLQTEDDKIRGVSPSNAHPVGQGRLCPKGWHSYEVSLNPLRLRKPLVKHNGKAAEATWTQALEAAAAGLRAIKEKYGAGALGVLGSAACTNEANFALMRLARQALGTNNVDFSTRLDLPGAHGLHTGATIEEIDRADLLLLVETDPSDDHPAVSARLVRARKRGAKIITISARRHRLARLAEIHLQPKAGRVIEVIAGLAAPADAEKAASACGVSSEDIGRAVELFAQAKKPLAVIGKGLLDDAQGKSLAAALGRMLVAGNWLALGARANSRGAHEMGLDPELLSGYRPLADAAAKEAFEATWQARLPEEKGLSLTAMAGTVKGLVIMGDDPVFSAPNPEKARQLIESLEFLVVIDSVKGDLAERADVALPGAAFGEENGTLTNLEGRLQRVRCALPPPGEAKENWDAVSQLARHLGADFGYRSPEAIMEQVAALTPLYEKVAYAALEEGKSILLASPATQAVADTELKLEPLHMDSDFPFWLMLDASIDVWEGDTFVLGCPVLRDEFTIQNKDFKQGYVLMHPDDARNLGLRNAGRLKVVAANGEYTTAVKISQEVPQGMVVLPFTQRGRALTILAKTQDERPAFEPVKVKIEGA